MFDLTHLNFIHGNSIKSRIMFKTPPEVRQNGSEISVIRELRNSPVTPFDRRAFGEAVIDALPDPRLDTDTLTTMLSPALLVSGFDCWHAGHYLEPDKRLGTIRFLHGVTPETPTSTHYFAGFSRDVCVGDTAYDAHFLETDQIVRGEDVVAVEAIERRIICERSLAGEISAAADAGALRARRMIAAAIQAER